MWWKEAKTSLVAFYVWSYFIPTSTWTSLRAGCYYLHFAGRKTGLHRPSGSLQTTARSGGILTQHGGSEGRGGDGRQRTDLGTGRLSFC